MYESLVKKNTLNRGKFTQFSQGLYQVWWMGCNIAILEILLNMAVLVTLWMKILIAVH